MKSAERISATSRPAQAAWKELVARHQRPDHRRATWQLVNSITPFLATWVAIYFALLVSWWLALPLAVLAGGLLVRIFIILHDCGHGSFYESRRANDFWGGIAGVLTFTPYIHWRWEHSIHHATSGNLDHRGVGDVWTMTVEEYLASSRARRFSYRVVRHPLVLLLVAPAVLFVGWQRFVSKDAGPRERRSVYGTNVALLATTCAGCAVFGIVPFLILQATMIAVAGAAGVWLFYVQHQFDGAYWERDAEWGYAEAALRGSSYYALPRVLQWFSGNIGFHHIHHLNPRIPNYHLERCHASDPVFQSVKRLTLLGSVSAGGLRLWDEATKELVGLRRVRELRAVRASSTARSRAG